MGELSFLMKHITAASPGLFIYITLCHLYVMLVTVPWEVASDAILKNIAHIACKELLNFILG